MTTCSIIDRQLQLEAEMTSLGVQRYKREQPMPWKETTVEGGVISRREEADLPPGQAFIAKNTQDVADVIREKLGVIHEGAAARFASVVPALLGDVSAEGLATLALRAALKGISEGAKLVATSRRLGELVEEHIAIDALFQREKKLGQWWEKKAERVSNPTFARKLMQHAASLELGESDWSPDQHMKVGMWLLEIVQDVTGVIETVLVRKSYGKKVSAFERMQPAPAFAEWLEAMHDRCALLTPVRLPMIAPPVRWTSARNGGYYKVPTKIMVGVGHAQLDDLDAANSMGEVYRALNTLQETRWQISRPVLEVLQVLKESPAGAPCIPAAEDTPLPVRPPHIPKDVPVSELSEEDRQALGEWRKATAAAYTEQMARLSKRVSFAQKVWVAERLVDEEQIYFPMQMDFRGRIYTMPSEISPQGDDLAKALLRFADRKPLGETGAFWLAVHVANTYGVDKVTFEERVQWVQDNEEMILTVGMGPADTAPLWTQADSPWQFMAACLEWTGYVLSGRSESFESGLPIGMDGSCSGLQHFSAILRDSVGGTAVNLVNTGKVEDLYSEVAKRVNARLDSSTCPDELQVWRGFVDRKIVKQPCMTYAYSATASGMRMQIMHALQKKDVADRPEGDTLKNASKLAPLVRECIEEVVIAAAGAMNWLQELAKVATDQGQSIRWTTPLGLPVTQARTKWASKMSSVWYCGKRIQPRVFAPTDKLDKVAQKSSIAPNWIHSLDATHLMMVTLDMVDRFGVTDFAMIHDSFGVHACHVEELHVSIRESFIELYLVNRLEELRDQMVVRLDPGTELPPLPPVGDLDLNWVLYSEYFFA
jgi:DNA-directed RNA polymerase